jgi:hypothetical protein
MKLKGVYDTQAEIPDSHRDKYHEQNGTWVLTEIDTKEEDFVKVSGTLEHEKRQRQEAVRKYEETVARYKDIDPAAALEARRRLEQLEEEKLKAEKNYEELAERKYARARKDLEEQFTHLKTQHETEKSARTRAEEQYARLVIDLRLRDAAVAQGIDPKSVGHVLKLTRDGWRMHEDGEQIALYKGDTPVYGKDVGKLQTPEEFYAELPKVDPVMEKFYLASSGGGSQNGGRLSNGAIVITREEARNTQTYEAAQARAEKAGVPLQVQ